MTKTSTQPAGATAADACTVVKLGQLDIDPMNVRRTDVEPTADFVANIAAEGVQQPLLVRTRGGRNPEMMFTFEGGKRLRSLRRLRDAGASIKGVAVTDDYLVPVVVKDLNDHQAKDMSLAMNLHRTGMHPVDRFEAFAELIGQGGETPASIAVRHGMTERAVTQALALGALSPKIRSAWRAGEIDAQTAEAFTLASTLAMQDKVFDKLGKKGGNGLSKYNIHRELKVSDDEVGQLMAYVGDDAYVNAGGKVTRDLFSATTAIVSDPPLLKQLAGDMLAQECERLVTEDGWKWAIVKPDHYFGGRDKIKPDFTPAETERMVAIAKRMKIIDAADDSPTMDGAVYEERDAIEAEHADIVLKAELRATTDKFRKSHGCMILVNEKGQLQVEVGYNELPTKRASSSSSPQPQLSGAAAAAVTKATAGQKAKKVAAGTVSNALNQRLSEQLTAAAESVMRTSPGLAPIALIAGALSGHKAVDVTVRGLALKKRGGSAHASFVNTFEALFDEPTADVMKELAGVAATALDFQEFNGDSPMKRKETAAVVNALDGPSMLTAIRKAWDAADYFGNVSADIRVTAVREALGEDRAREVSKMKKDAAVKWCTTNVPGTGWLPPQLRVDAYKAPSPGKTSAKAPAKAAPAKPAAKKKAKAKKAKAKK